LPSLGIGGEVAVNDKATTDAVSGTPRPGENSILAVEGVTKRYGDRTAITGVDLHVARGEIVGLLGPNGAGKTTLVEVVVGLRRPDEGTVSICGLDAGRHRREVGRMIGLAPQELGIYPRATVAENLQFFVGLAGLSRRQAIFEPRRCPRPWGWARAVAPATPSYWAMRGFRSVILDGDGIGDVVAPVVALLAFAAVFALIAAVRFRFDEVKSSFL